VHKKRGKILSYLRLSRIGDFASMYMFTVNILIINCNLVLQRISLLLLRDLLKRKVLCSFSMAIYVRCTLEGSSSTDIMTCTGGCGYSF